MRPRNRRRIRTYGAGALAAAAVVAVLVAVQSDGATPQPVGSKNVTVVPRVALQAGAPATGFSLPRAAVVSFDLSLPAGSELDLAVGGRTVVIRPGSRRGWAGEHVELTTRPARLGVNGVSRSVSFGRGRQLNFSARGRSATLSALIVSPRSDRAALLFHRLAELHARTPPGKFPVGADAADALHFDRNWMIGFWAGSLWQAAASEPAGGLFARWALTATTVGFHPQGPPSHDLGFQYGQSWQAAWEALCQGRSPKPSICPRLRRTVLAAADKLVALGATNSAAGTIPVIGEGPVAVTIIDSMMNLELLTWAGRVTGNPKYAQLVSRHAHTVASVLVRRDGSTAQAVNYDRATGRILSVGTHQGLSDSSTWSRGQGWAVSGFAQTAASLHDRTLLEVAERVARYVARKLPDGGVPPWDYDAPPGAPVDVSAAVITSAGLLRLARACRSMPGVCTDQGRWVPLARRMLASSLAHARAQPPLGFLGPQLLNERNPPCWCNHGELTLGLSYALEAARSGA